MKAMVVDDAIFMRKMVTDIIIRGGHEVVAEASNGIEAVAKYKEVQPDIVTMDITMPEMDGIAAVKQIRNEYPEAKILMCSAMGQQALVIEAIQAGAKDFIVKPFQPERVIEAINKVLNV